MDMISYTQQHRNFQQSTYQDHITLLSECLLMAGAIKRHNEDAALMLGDNAARAMVEEMRTLMEGADGLLSVLSFEQDLDSFEALELRMVWNKLRYIVASTYQGQYFTSNNYN